MLYALRHPVALVGLLLGFLLGLGVRGFVQARLAARLGDRGPLTAGQGRFDLRREVDPFGAVAAALGGVGWGRPVELAWSLRRTRRGALLAVLLAGPVALAALGALLLALYAAVGGPRLLDVAGIVPDTVHGAYVAQNPGQTLLLFAGVELLAMALLALVPLPPLDGGGVLFLFAPRSSGWQKAQYYLQEQNVGTVVLLVLLLIPLGGQDPLLLFVLDAILHPLLGAGTL